MKALINFKRFSRLDWLVWLEIRMAGSARRFCQVNSLVIPITCQISQEICP